MSEQRDIWLQQRHNEAVAFACEKRAEGWNAQQIQEALNNKNRARENENAGNYGPE